MSTTPKAAAMNPPEGLPLLPEGSVFRGQLKHHSSERDLFGYTFDPGHDREWVGPMHWSGALHRPEDTDAQWYFAEAVRAKPASEPQIESSPTPETDAHQAKEGMAHDWLWRDFARRLERERDALKAEIAARKDQWRVSSIARELKAENGRLREALEQLRADEQTCIDQYNANGPQWTSRETGAEYYDASYVIASAEENIANITKALAGKAEP